MKNKPGDSTNPRKKTSKKDVLVNSGSNYLPNEKVKTSEQAQSLFYQISKTIAAVKNGRELLKIIIEYAQPAFGFHDIGLSVLDKSGDFYLDWAVFYAEISPSEKNSVQRENERYKIPVDEPLFKYGFARAATEGKPFIVNLTAEFIEEFKDFPYLPFEIANGYKQFLVTTLKFGGEAVGFLNFNGLRENNFESRDLELFQAIADLVAVAVANITANEEILERTREKSALLSISKDIGSARSAVELMQVIRNKAQSLIPFFDTGILIVEADGQHHYDLSVDLTGWDDSITNIKLQTLAADRLVHPGSYVEYVMRLFETTNNPVIENFDERFQEFDHPYFAILKECGYKEALVAALKSGGNTFGTLWLNSLEKNHFSPKQFEVFQTLTDQVAAAVSNILASQEILEREREKTTLLSVSEAIANVRDKDKLFRIFNRKLRPILGYDYAAVLEVDSTVQNYRYYPAISDQSLEANELYKVAAQFRPLNSFIENALDSADPVTYLTDELLKKYSSGPELNFQQSLGIKQSVILGLKNAGQKIGLFILHYKTQQNIKPEQFPLLRSIGNQVAGALGNILASEEIKRQLDEIENLKTQLEVDNSYLVEEVKTNYNFEEIIGAAPTLRTVFEEIELVAPTGATILLEGETGTGKELFARAIHNLSPRAKRPLIKVNCAALPSNLVESELFGHERGSFTGATERRIGKFELANNGTIFLDEIGELPLELQAKLLRVLQEQEVERIGGKSPLKLNIRVIAATNRNLREEVAVRRFRSDLYFRLNTVTLNLPPLRERREDIPALAVHFVEKYSNRTGKRIKSVATSALQEMMSYDFPGNIRELEHLIEESVIFCKTEKLDLHRPLLFDRTEQTVSNDEIRKPAATLADNEREHILTILRQTSGRIRGENGAAEILNVKATTLEARMKRLGIEKRHIFEHL